MSKGCSLGRLANRMVPDEQKPIALLLSRLEEEQQKKLTVSQINAFVDRQQKFEELKARHLTKIRAKI